MSSASSFGQRICLNMIVKNEMANLPRALGSVVGHVTTAVILDTGSTDGTPEFCKAFLEDHGIKTLVPRGKFINFEQARNEALMHARAVSRLWDYVLFMDADMELVVDGPLPRLERGSYTMLQKQGGLAYHNCRLLSEVSSAQYHGVTHEFIATPDQMPLPGDVWWFKDHATGSNRPGKYERDRALLEDYLKTHPDDGRTLYYLAQTEKDAGNFDKAMTLYKRRIEVGGWDEEVWHSRLCVARLYRQLGNEAEFIRHALIAYNSRPHRWEPIYDLARHFRDKPDMQNAGWLFAEMGDKIPPTRDLLFVEQWQRDYGFTMEKSILGAYNAKTKQAGFEACNTLALSKTVPDHDREGARRNLYWYLSSLKDIAPSFMAKKIPQVNADGRYTNANPSVAVIDGAIKAVVRTVSYRIRPDGTYDYYGFDAIRTTNFLADFKHDLSYMQAVELQRPTGMPDPCFTGVLGVEDMRLYTDYSGQLWANGCVLEQNLDAWREQFTMRINPDTGEVDRWVRVDPKFIPKQHEKNWMPIVGEPMFMYRPGTVIDAQGYPVKINEPALAVDQFSGGGQVVPFEAGWAAIIHEARPNPINGKRFYQHRFVWFDDQFALQKVSLPFVFFDRQIEFAAGLAIHPATDDFIVSFGIQDREAWIGTISQHDMRALIWHP